MLIRFNFAKYGTRYLSAFVYRFNRRFHLDTLPMHLRVPPLPVNHVLHLGSAKLKNLANQEERWAEEKAVSLPKPLEKEPDLQLLLDRSNSELEAFAYIVSHDLQEPLRGISNFTQFIHDGASEKLAPQQLRWLDTVMSLTERMNCQIDTLLQYSRAAQQPLMVQTVDLNELVSSVLDDLSALIKKTNTQIEIPRLLPSVNCDPIRSVVVFENLITNAIIYNEQPEKRVEIGYRESDLPIFFVRDNGIGIAEKFQEVIFEIFRRLHNRDEYGGGMGAGLTITRKHIQRQGGRMWLESIPSQGSTFHFTLNPEP